MKIKKTAAVLLTGSLLGITAYSSTAMPSQVQAKSSYRIQLTKKAYVYTSKGKKTKTSYKKNKVVTAYRVRKIKGKKYYDLGRGKYIRTSNAKKYVLKKKAVKKVTYKTTTQTKKLIRTIKLYKPTGTESVVQNAYVKRSVKQNTKTGKKTYGAWSTSSWAAYTVPAVSGYTASPTQVPRQQVFATTKNTTVSVKYKEVKNTLTIAPANFNITAINANSEDTLDAYELKNDQTLDYSYGYVENALQQSFHDDSTKTYPWVYTVTAEGIDKKGIHYYELKEDLVGSSGVWVKASDFKKTEDANNVVESARFTWTEKENRAVEQADLKLINAYRAAVGVAPLTINQEQQAATDARAVKGAEYTKVNGELSHNLFFGSGENLALTDTWEMPTQAYIDFTVDSLKYCWDIEKEAYDSHSKNQETGHYENIINPEFKTVSISTVTYDIDHQRYAYTVEEYFR